MSLISLPVPDRFSNSGTALNLRWWESFQDPELNQLIEKVLCDNLELKQAWARLEQAKAAADQSKTYKWPVFTLDAGTSRSRNNIAGQNSNNIPVRTTSYFTSAGASYEIDLWAKMSALKKAAHMDAIAVQNDLESMAMTLAAEVAETWFSLIEHYTRLELLNDQIETNNIILDLIKLRFGHGLIDALDIYQQNQLLASTHAQVPILQSKIEILQHKLAVLLGKPPKEDIFKSSLLMPEVPELPKTGLPLDLLNNRPDIRAAQLRLSASDQRVWAAIADQLPSIKLGASAGYRASKFSDVFENLIWDILANISHVLWDGGNKSAQVQQTKARLKENTAAYVQTALKAFQEVEDALVQEKYQQIYIEKLETQFYYSKMTLEQSAFQYKNGLINYLPVLTALSSVQNLEQNLISAKKDLLSHRIQLCRALGGIWTKDLIQK